MLTNVTHILDSIKNGFNSVQPSFSMLLSEPTVPIVSTVDGRPVIGQIAVASGNLAIEAMRSYIKRQRQRSQDVLWDL